MNKFALAALLSGVALASCSGQGASPAVPGAGPGSAPSSFGAHSTRAQSLNVAPAGWSATATQAISLANATDLGALDGSASVDVTLGLQMRNPDGAKAAIAAGQVLSRDEFVSQYAPTADQVASAVNYLQAQGFTNIAPSPNNMIVSATASAATVQKAFNTTIHSFSTTEGHVFANTQPAYVPTALSGNVVAVLGLTNARGFKAGPPLNANTSGTTGAATGPTSCTKSVNTTTGAPVCPRFYDPATFNIAYNAGTTPAGTNTAMAIFVVGDPSGAIANFRTNEQKFGMPQVPVRVIHAGPASSDASGNGEWNLDMTYGQAMAKNLKAIDLYAVHSFAFSDLAVAFHKWASDDIAPIMNASVGGCEVFPYQDGSMLVADMALVEAAAQGQTLFASTGDTGGYCGIAGVPPNGGVGGVPMVEYPAASPYAVAVGGTDLFTNVDGTYLGEQSWEAGGGGVSQFEYSPYWEAGVQPVGTTPAGLSFRGLPDVAFDAAIETGAILYSNDQAANGSCSGGCITGGTSLASPMAAGIYARMQSSHGNRLGFAPIRYYHIFANSAATQIAGPPETELIGPFHDILQGTNGLYTALPKYDYTTGLGSNDISRLYSVIGY